MTAIVSAFPNFGRCWAPAALSATLAVASPAAATEFATLQPFAGAPSATVLARDLEGAALAISAEPARTVIVHFFASWCEPCRDELPELMRFVDARTDGVRLIGVDVGEPASRARSFVARIGFDAPVAIDEDKKIAAAFQVRGLPGTVVLAPHGASALVAAGPLDWASPSVGDAIKQLKQP